MGPLVHLNPNKSQRIKISITDSNNTKWAKPEGNTKSDEKVKVKGNKTKVGETNSQEFRAKDRMLKHRRMLGHPILRQKISQREASMKEENQWMRNTIRIYVTLIRYGLWKSSRRMMTTAHWRYAKGAQKIMNINW